MYYNPLISVWFMRIVEKIYSRLRHLWKIAIRFKIEL